MYYVQIMQNFNVSHILNRHIFKMCTLNIHILNMCFSKVCSLNIYMHSLKLNGEGTEACGRARGAPYTWPSSHPQALGAGKAGTATEL